MPRPRRLPTVLTRPEVAALLQRANPRYLTGHRDRCLMQLMLHAGLRTAEVLALTIYDIDWRSGQLTVRQGKGQKDRILWLNEALLEDVRRWRAAHLPRLPIGSCTGCCGRGPLTRKEHGCTCAETVCASTS